MTDAIMPDAAFLASLLTELRLPNIARKWRRIAEAADCDGWPAQKTIAALMEIEVAERASRRIRRHRDQSEAPAGKTPPASISTPRRACANSISWRSAPAETRSGRGQLKVCGFLYATLDKTRTSSVMAQLARLGSGLWTALFITRRS
ncbi:hypothetical protein [Rhodoblastus sphagnicola]|nr:hypothetical protein [Rhodoblastus sphagnicola]